MCMMTLHRKKKIVSRLKNCKFLNKIVKNLKEYFEFIIVYVLLDLTWQVSPLFPSVLLAIVVHAIFRLAFGPDSFYVLPLLCFPA